MGMVLVAISCSYTTHPKYNEKATLCVKIIISPIEPVEDFYVSIIMQDDQDAVISE